MNRPLRGLLSALCLLPAALSAADPASGTLTPDSGPLTYTSGPFLVSDPCGECAIVFSGATAAEKLSRSTHTEDVGVRLENYTLRSDTFCLPNRPPFSLLSVSDTTPSVGSTVTFDGSGSTDDDGEPIVSDLFDFGDGTQLETDQPVVEHVYNEAGLYRAQLETVDERGRKSDNIAQAQIDVSGEASQAGRGATGVGAGGSMGRLGLLALVMALLMVRRPRRR